jgi:glycosyltransferase involved in cell wall biosynthesis
LADALRKSAVFVAPLRFAAGVQNKVLEAMATAVPVVTTSIVNAGLAAQSEHELLLADDAPTCAAQIVRLLQDANLRRAIGAAGQNFVQQRFSWLGAVNRMHEIAEHLTMVGDGGGKL